MFRPAPGHEVEKIAVPPKIALLAEPFGEMKLVGHKIMQKVSAANPRMEVTKVVGFFLNLPQIDCKSVLDKNYGANQTQIISYEILPLLRETISR
jgi:hypothetical protein